MEELVCFPVKTEHSSSSTEIFPLLSPRMESELLKEDWPKLEKNLQSQNNSSFWEENYQDLSDWCVVDPKTISRFHIPPPFQGQRDYRIGEDITCKNSGVKDNNDNLSNNKSGLKEIRAIDENWTVDNNSVSIGMSSEGSLPVGQDQFNAITDLSDVLFEPLQTTDGFNEHQTIDSMKFISEGNDNITDPNLELIGETLDNWFPIISTDNISCNNTLVPNIQDHVILDGCPSTSALSSADDEIDKKHLVKDFLLPIDIGPESFDLVSYVFNEGGNILEQKNNEEKAKSGHTSNIAEISYQAENNNKSKQRRERKISQARANAEPYVPPLKINLKSKTLSTNNRRESKQFDQESVNCTDSESDTHTSSDYNYRELREKNNKASRKSRINKKVKETEMMKRANDLERNNAVLKMKVEELEKLVITMRTALLQSALKKEK